MNHFQRRTSMLLIGLTVAWGFGVQAEEKPTTTEAPATATTETTEAAPAAKTDPVQVISAETATADRVLGDENAPVTIVEYASFTCPHCRDYMTTVWPKLKEQYVDTGKVKVIYREVYFDGAGILAASLARCVPEEQYFPMSDALYEQYDVWLKGQTDMPGIVRALTDLGLQAGLSKDKIVACLDDRQAQELMVANSQKNMDQDNVRGTPTLIINGELVKDWQWENLQPLLDKEIAAAEPAKTN